MKQSMKITWLESIARCLGRKDFLEFIELEMHGFDSFCILFILHICISSSSCVATVCSSKLECIHDSPLDHQFAPLHHDMPIIIPSSSQSSSGERRRFRIIINIRSACE